LKDFPATPFKRIADEPEERIVLIQVCHLSGKPKFYGIWRMVTCSMVSNAFSKSSFNMMASLLD
jgi:hypothetical protein